MGFEEVPEDEALVGRGFHEDEEGFGCFIAGLKIGHCFGSDDGCAAGLSEGNSVERVCVCEVKYVF